MNYINFELLKNIGLLAGATLVSLGLVILYIKIYYFHKKIKKINENIESYQTQLDNLDLELEKDKGNIMVTVDFYNTRGISKKEIAIAIERLKREKQNIFEEISLLKIFKK